MRAIQALRGVMALRRQSDKVKLALLLCLLAAWLGARAAEDALSWGKAAAQPAEYVLAPDADGAALSAKLDALYETEGVAAVTPQWEEGADETSRNTLAAPAYRVRCDTADLSGGILHRAQALGFIPADAGERERQALESRLLETRLFYRLLACGLSAAAGWALYRLGKADIKNGTQSGTPAPPAPPPPR